MSLALGVDTGGTYTDAVLIRDEAEVIASACILREAVQIAVDPCTKEANSPFP